MAKSAAMASSYPILDNKDLLLCLKEMGVTITAEQLAKPTPEVVRTAYEYLLTMLLGVTKEEMDQPVFEAIDELEYPELYDESIPVLTCFIYLRRLMGDAGYHDFSMRDLTKPEEHRLRRQLSAIVNFARFREGKLDLYLEWQSETEAQLEEQAALAEVLQRLKAELQQMEEERAAQDSEVARLRTETEEICAENSRLASEQTQLQQEVANLQAETSAREHDAQEQQLRLSAEVQEGDRLRGQIVESPEELRRSLEELQQAVATEEEAAAQAERRERELAARLDTIAKVEQQLTDAMEQLEGLGKDMEKKKTVSRRVKALRTDIAAKVHEEAQLRTEHEHLTRQREHLLEQIARHSQQSKLKREAALAQVEQQQKVKEAIQADNAATIAKLAEHDSKKRSLQEGITELEATCQAQKENVLSQYQALLRQVDVYHAKLGDVMHPKPISHTPLKPINHSLAPR